MSRSLEPAGFFRRVLSARRSGGGRSLGGLWPHLFSFLTVWLLTAKAAAHPMIQNAMWILLKPESVEVRMTVSVRELCVVQGLPLATDGSVDPGLAEDTAPRHREYVLDHLNLRADDQPLSGKVTSIDPPAKILSGAEGTDRSFFTYHLEYPLSPRSRSRFSLRQSMVKEFPSAPGVPWDLSYAYRCGTPAEPMKTFGVLPRDVVINFLPDATMAPEDESAGKTPGRVPPAQAGLMVLFAAFGFSVISRREAWRTAAWAMGFFALGGVWFALSRHSAPGWLITGLGGVGILLTSVDNIHRAGAPADKRRLLLTSVFPLATGYGAAQLAASAAAAGAAIASGSTPAAAAAAGGGNPVGPSDALLGAAHFALPAGVVFLLTAAVMLRLEKLLSPKALRALRQWLSLLCAAMGLLILFHGLGIRPVDYWLNRLTGSGR